MTEVNEMINNLVKKANVALKEMSAFDQEKVDKIVDAMVQAGLEHSVELGNLAYSETGRGVAHDKAIKNVFAAGQVGESIKNHKTVGIIDENKEDKTITVAEPLGVLAGITPVTNPTSTTIFKSILSMKTRNAIVFSFHPQAMKSSAKAAEIVRDAAIAAGAPKDCIQWITEPSIEATNQLINNPGIASTLATGGPAMVKAAYSTGKPALGVGPGNGPLYIEKSADIDAAVKDVVASKTFDNGMICATENSLIIDNDIYEEIKQKLQASGVFFVKSADQAALAEAMFNPETGGVKGPIAGAKATKIAKMAGIEVPEDTKVLAAELDGIGHDYLLSGEKLSPVVSVYKANDQADAFDIATRLLEYGGLGHTAAIRTEDRDVAIKFGEEMQACRILVNTPCGLGGVGAINGLAPSLTLGTGTWGANSIDHNVNDYDLINRKVIAGCLKNDYLDSLIAKYAD